MVLSAKLSVNSYLDGDNTAEENLGKRLAQIKLILYGDGDHPEVDEEKALEVGKSVQSVSPYKSFTFFEYLVSYKCHRNVTYITSTII